ncbi:steroid receptor RNA activator 1-like [Mercenaria mercenaria]|uniref:steroid receptor RNA activator 1-like n=1 Tax=Mercenaria mercenaria TaxID=6596 RepID=UPI00234EF7A2|nr:steroid receptor RNA activator 1-like [Mercenaria mercenaria]
MAASRTRPGNPERGWNDPPMFNYNTEKDGSTQPKRALNKRVAFPVSGNTKGPTPGYAVLNPSQGPPILNPVLPADIQGPPPLPSQPPIPIGLRDTPLGNQAAPQSPIQLLPPSADTSTPQTVPILVPLLVPSSPPKSEEQVPEAVQLEDERLEELLSRLSFDTDSQLLQLNINNFESVLNKYRNILTLKVCDEIKKKLELFEEKWKKGCLSDNVKVRITQLSTALLNGETDKANHLHLALMVDHIAEVGTVS